MNVSEAAEILALAAVYDRRTVGREDAKAFAMALDGLDVAQCAEAVVAHYRDQTTWLMPAHIRRWITSGAAREAEINRWRDRHGPAAILDGDTEETYAARAQERNRRMIEAGEVR